MNDGRMTKLFAIDIETVSQGSRANEYTDKAKYKLGNVKDPKKIEAKIEEKKNEARGKHALSWWLGKIVSVSVVDVFGDSESIAIYGHDESEILNNLSVVIDQYRCVLIGKSSHVFDYPYIVGRYISNNISVPDVLMDKRKLLDVDTFFGFSAATTQRSKLDSYAHGMDFAMKPMEGSHVGSLYSSIVSCGMSGDEEGEKEGWKKLTDYNIHDSEVVAEISRRYFGHSRRWV